MLGKGSRRLRSGIVSRRRKEIRCAHIEGANVLSSPGRVPQITLIFADPIPGPKKKQPPAKRKWLHYNQKSGGCAQSTHFHLYVILLHFDDSAADSLAGGAGGLRNEVVHSIVDDHG